ncbi:hypothetical protein F0562_020255 [Nyssa sinensis]|uniref:DUF674 domain-containing protein n=1 Tax=Nyssa sinensis TaxID=561372 RepID=A0A5J5BVZ9_9ASTE|nr:hypothetical protein F0562_020255 [Nyssa sinensis]
MLLRPRSAAEIHYSKLKLDLVNSSNNEYFVCEDHACDFVSLYQTATCNCRRPFKYKMKLSENQSSVPQDGGVFVKPTTCIMIDDKFRIEPVSIKHGYKLLEELQLTGESKVERRTAHMGRDERTLRSKFEVKLFELGSNSNDQEGKTSRGFVKGPSKFMVENNLSVTPLSPSYVITLMRKIKVLEKDIEVLDVTVDKDKASHLLTASLVSSSALADVFRSNGQKQEDDEHVAPVQEVSVHFCSCFPCARLAFYCAFPSVVLSSRAPLAIYFKIMVKGALRSVEVLVSEETKQVVFVEADQEFFDVLLSFITMPVGMIIRSLIHDNLLKNEMGCLKNLYRSVEKLDENYLLSAMCKDMLLCPRSAAEIHYRKLDLDLVGSSSNQYYACEDQGCDFVSFYQTDHCHCGRAFKYGMILSENQSFAPQDGGVFVKPTTRIMIDDKFRVDPVSIENSLKLLKELQLTDESKVERWIHNIGRAEVLKLMVCSLVSKTPFSDIFLNNPPDSSNYHGKYVPRRPHLSQRVTDNSSDDKQISLKLFIDKPKNRVLYAEAGEDFVDLLFSFLTIPLGYFFKKFRSLSFKGSMRNLYNNIQLLGDRFFKSKEMKETLVNPKLAPGLAQHNQLIDLDEAPNPSYKTLCSNFEGNRFVLSENTNHHDVKTGKGFVKGSSKFMVKNNLFVTPLSPSYGITLMGKKNVRAEDIEALHLLAASLVSKSALTDVFILNEPTKAQNQGCNVGGNYEDDDDCCCCCPF